MRQAKVTREDVAKRSGHEPGYVLAMFDLSEPNPTLRFYLDLLEAAGARMETANGNTTRHVVSRINELRELCDLKIAALAKKAGMHRSHLSRIINDDNPNMQLAVFDSLVEVLGAERELRIVARNFISRVPVMLAAGAEMMSGGDLPPPPRPNLHAVTGIPTERRTAPPFSAPETARATAGPRPTPSVGNTGKAPERPAPPTESRPPEPDPRLVAAEEHAAREKARADAANSRADAANSRADAANSRADAAFARASQERVRADAEKARADAASGLADAASGRADAASARASQEQARADAEKARAEAASGRADAAFARASQERVRADEEKARAAQLKDEMHRQRSASAAEMERLRAQAEAFARGAKRAARDADNERREAEYRARELERQTKNAKIVGWTLSTTLAGLAGILIYDNYTKRT